MKKGKMCFLWKKISFLVLPDMKAEVGIQAIKEPLMD